MRLILHFISKYSLILLVYFLLLGICMKVFGKSYKSLIIVALILFIAMKFKILEFSSCWLK